MQANKNQVLYLTGRFITLFMCSIDVPISIDSQLDKSITNICGDPSQLHQVLMNLSLNSEDALKDIEKPHIIFTSQQITLQEQQAKQLGLQPKK